MHKPNSWASLLWLGFFALSSCQYEPAQLPQGGWVHISVVLNNPLQYTSLRLAWQGQWLRDTEPPPTNVTNTTQAGETIDNPSWAPYTTGSAFGITSFSITPLLRPGVWRFTIQATSGASPIASFDCEQEIFLGDPTPLTAIEGSANCIYTAGGGTVDWPPITDVAVSDVSATPSPANQGSPVTVSVIVANDGTVSADMMVSVTVSPPAGGVAGTVNPPVHVAGLGVGASTPVSFGWNTSGASPGTHTLTATATIDAPAVDVDPSDDSRSTTARIVVHDLAVTSVTATPVAVNEGSPSSVAVQVTNHGSEDETSVQVTLTETPPTGGQPGAITPASRTINLLNAGAVSTVTFNWNSTGATPGNHTFTAAVQPVAGEANTANNGGAADVRVILHDVAVSAVRAPSPVFVSCPDVVSVDVANRGTETENVTVSLSDGQPATIANSPQSVSLNPQGSAGDAATMTFDWTPNNAASHPLTAQAGAVPGETSVADNTASTSASVTSPNAPSVTGITPNTMQANNSVSVTISGSNFACPPAVSFQGPQSNNAVVTQVTRVDATTVTALVTVGSIGPPQLVWDVVVTNPDGQNGVLTGGFTVTR